MRKRHVQYYVNCCELAAQLEKRAFKLGAGAAAMATRTLPSTSNRCRRLWCSCYVFSFFFFLASDLPGTLSGHSESPPRLLLLLLDGVRFDYLNQSDLPLPGFQRLVKEGVHAGALVPVFPTLSFPNWYSLMTGLHVESHSMTGNYMYDVLTKQTFLLTDYPNTGPHWWQGAEPFWITAARQNKKSHLFYWGGCEVEIRGHRPTFCQTYPGVILTRQEFTSALNTSLTLLSTGETDVAGVYYEEIDHVGHVHGPFSAELNASLIDIDHIMSDLLDRLSDPDLSGVNLMVFSDHGMTELSRSRFIDLSQVLDPSDYVTLMEGSPLAYIYTTPGKEQEVYNKLKDYHPHLTVYHKSDLPERWHLKHGRFMAPLIAVADLGWFIKLPEEEDVTRYPFHLGMHGFDNISPDMQGIFLGTGPAFRKGQRVERLRSVDLYQVMCHILRVTPSPHNGTFSDVIPLLTSDDAGYASSSPVWWLMTLLSAVAIYVLYRKIQN